MSYSNSAQALMEMDRAHALHPFTHFESFNQDGALVIMEGSGARLKDATGREFFDAVGVGFCREVHCTTRVFNELLSMLVNPSNYCLR